MTKSAKAQKQKKCAKLKPILKLSRKLKKSQNETKTEFKARKIVLKAQFEDNPEFLADRKNISIKELLSRLSHHNKDVRTDAINRVKDIIQSHEAGLYANSVSAVIKSLGPCLLDQTSIVRKSSIKCINTLIQMNRREVEPFLDLLVSYSSCAMVHIDVDVQEDSLLIIDSIRVMVPLMNTEMINMLLSNFLGLICRKIKDTGENFRTKLDFKPDSALTQVNWRAKLLSSLDKFLGTILKQCGKLQKCDLSDDDIVLRNSFPCSGNAGNNVFLINIFTSSLAAEAFVKNVTEILYITWVECSAQLSKGKGGKGLSKIDVFEIIINILNLLRDISLISERNDPTERNWFSRAICKNFQSKIMDDFPYCSPVEMNEKNDGLEVSSWNLNFAVANFAMTLFEANPSFKLTLVKYCIDILNDSNTNNKQNMEKIVSLCLKLLEENSKVEFKYQEELLAAALNCFRIYGTESDPESYIKARELLLSVPVRAAEWECGHLRRSYVLENWIKVLALESDKDWPAVKTTLIELKLRNPPNFRKAILQMTR